MASVILTVVGTAVGGPIGGLIGGLVGRSVDRAILGGSSSRTVEGGRMKDLNVQTSAYGEPISRVYGTMRLPGNVVWSSGLKERRNENTQSSGGKGGGRSVTTVAYSYSVSFAVILSGREISDVGRVWADGKLLRDGAGKIAVGGKLRIYKGTDFQNADPLIEALEGMANANHFHNLAYVVFEDIELAEYANRIPNLTFEIIADTGGEVMLSSIVGDICGLSHVPLYDATDLTQMVKGFMIPGPMKSRAAIEELAQIYHFDVVEQEGSLVFRNLNRLQDVSILENDFVIDAKKSSRQDKITLVRQQDLALPKEIGLSFIDPDRDYQAGHQRARRLNVASDIVSQNSYPIVLSSNWAKTVSEIQLDLAWYGRDQAAFMLPPKYSDLLPGDIVSLTLGGELQGFLLQETEIGQQGVRCQAMRFSKALLERSSIAESGVIPAQLVEEIAASQFFPLDIPSLAGDNVTSPILLWAAGFVVGKWNGASLFISRDNDQTYTQLGSIQSDVVYGTVENILLNGPTAYWDLGNEMLVRLGNAKHTLFGQTADDVLGGANIAWVGGEIIQFQNAILEIDGRYRLSGLLRGRRGTERNVDGHILSEIFVLLTDATVNGVGMNFSDIGQIRQFKAVTSGSRVENTMPVDYRFEGVALKPFSPVHAQGIRDSSGNLTLKWIRRSRVGGEWMDNANVPLGEIYEKYDIEILDGVNIVRILTSNIQEVSYPASLQIDDFGTIQPSLTVRISQISDGVGRGWPLTDFV